MNLTAEAMKLLGYGISDSTANSTAHNSNNPRPVPPQTTSRLMTYHSNYEYFNEWHPTGCHSSLIEREIYDKRRNSEVIQ